MKTKKKLFSRISDSPVFGIGSMLLVNTLTILLLVNVGRYVSVSKKIFVMIIGGIVVLALLVNLLFMLGFGFRKKVGRRIFLGLSVFLILIYGVGSFYLTRINTAIDDLISKDNIEKMDYHVTTIYEGISLSNLTSMNTLGYVGGSEDFDTAVDVEIAKHSNAIEIIEYETYQEMLDDYLLEGILDIAILPEKFMGYAENMDETSKVALENAIILDTFNIQVSGSGQTNVSVLEEPFTVLMIGVNENLADSIILATVNPKTLNITMTSIARDSYVPISCYRGTVYDKITHSRNISRNCLIETVEDLFELEVDFFFETDFYALVKIVDALGGLEIESPIAFGGSLPKEDNPREYHEIYVPKGKNLLNGHQVITFARERHHFANGDFQRQLNQQYVIKEVASKIITESKSSLETLIRVIEAGEDNIVMNMTMKDHISPIFGLLLNHISVSPVNAMDTFVIQNTQIYGTTPLINGMSVVVPYRYSLEDNKKVIHANLSDDIPDPQAMSFSFSINRPYKFDVDTNVYKYVGTPLYFDYSDLIVPDVFTVPSFLEMTLDEAQSWADTNGVRLDIEWVEGETEGKIVGANVAAGDHDAKMNAITIRVENGELVVDNTFVVPYFLDMTVAEAEAWASEHDVILTFEEKFSDTVPVGSIASANVVNGEHAEKVEYITIYISKGPENTGDESANSETPTED